MNTTPEPSPEATTVPYQQCQAPHCTTTFIAPGINYCPDHNLSSWEERFDLFFPVKTINHHHYVRTRGLKDFVRSERAKAKQEERERIASIVNRMIQTIERSESPANASVLHNLQALAREGETKHLEA